MTDTVDETIMGVIRRFCYSDENAAEDAEEAVEEAMEGDTELTWRPVDGTSLKHFPFTVENTGIKVELFGMIDKAPRDFFNLFVNEEIIALMVTETNRYARQTIGKSNLQPQSRLHKWTDTTSREMKSFLGILIWTGLCQFPQLISYWSKNVLYSNKVKNVMPRNRFELLLRMWHFADNEAPIENDRLRRLRPLLELLIEKFKAVRTPEENVTIDETLVPFRGRLLFKQYIPNKRHKFGIKLFKMCLEGGYTYDVRVYCGSENDPEISVPTKVVMTMMSDLLNTGRTVYTDNYYTSVTLAHQLLEQQTHLVGTLRANRKLNPKDVTQKKLKKNEFIARESNTGVVVMKWRDKRDVLVLSTKHTDNMVKIQQRGGEVEKPNIITEYNRCKGFIDLSDQFKAYSSSLRKGIKWYRKIAVELLLGSAIVNAHLVYQKITGNKSTITAFKEELALSLLNLEDSDENIARPSSSQMRHYLKEVTHSERRRCVVCYANLSKEHGRQHAQKKTPFSKYKCEQCNQFLCVTCFSKVHLCMK